MKQVQDPHVFTLRLIEKEKALGYGERGCQYKEKVGAGGSAFAVMVAGADRMMPSGRHCFHG